MKTNIIRGVLQIVDKHFPPQSKWSRHFNRHTIRPSFSCTNNVAVKIAQHNARVLRGGKKDCNEGCNCPEKRKKECPIPGNCMAQNVIYGALIESETKNFGYYGMTGRRFKTRYNEHMGDIRHCHERNKDGDRTRNGTVLSRKIEELENAGKQYKIKWSIVDKAYPLKAGAKSCDLCSSEKMHIALGSKGFHKWPPGCIMLNKRREILNKCVHRRSYTLAQA